MKKGIVGAGLSALFVLLLVSCHKLDDLLHKDPLVTDECAIATVHVPWGDEGNGPYTSVGVFHYNTLGQPVSINFDHGCATGAPSPTYLFRYDKAHRLTDYIESCENFFDVWHTYKYNSKGLIVKDSIYIWGDVSGGHPSETAYDSGYTDYTYDAEGRMTQATTFRSGEDYADTTTYTFAYNNAGNVQIRDYNGIVIRSWTGYDDKINVCRTNKIWMFLNRDYSRNNYIAADSYNEHGLPLQLPVSFSNFHFSNEETGNMIFDYTCKAGHN